MLMYPVHIRNKNQLLRLGTVEMDYQRGTWKIFQDKKISQSRTIKIELC